VFTKEIGILALAFRAAVVLLAAGCSGSGGEETDGAVASDGPAASDGGVVPDAGGGRDIGQTPDAGQGEDVSKYPDPAFVHEVRTQPLAVPDETYEQEFTRYFRTTADLPDLDVRALAVIEGVVYAGTASGAYYKPVSDETFGPFYLPRVEPLAVVDIADTYYQGMVAVAFSDRVELVSITDKKDEPLPLVGPAITSVATDGTRLVVGTEDGVWEWKNDVWQGTLVMDSLLIVKDVAIHSDGKVYAATLDRGVAFGTDFIEGMLSAAGGDLADDDVRSVASCGSRLVFGTKNGVAVHDGSTKKIHRAGPGSFPTADNLAVACNDTHVLAGHAIGATLVPYNVSKIDHYASGRWVLDNRVAAVALDDGPVVWTGGSKGVTSIFRQTRKLSDKEKVFDEITPNYWRLGGFVAAEGWTPTAWDDPATMFKDDKDNDGLWTQMMIGGWCFAYAATGDEKYHEYARQAMENMYLEIDVPAVTFTEKGMKRGFIARSLIGEEETTLWERKKTEAEYVEVDGKPKNILRWNEVEYNGKKYLWKADTSSDEYAGHFFGYPIYFDLCADDEEKAKIADHLGAAAAYVIDGGFKLLDLDGTRTTFGRWEPEYIPIAVDGPDKCNFTADCIASWGGGGWLNGTEALGMMLAAWHVTGDTKFYDAYEYLIDLRYGEMVVPNMDTATITQPAIANHSDHELAMLAYTTLIRYEPNDERRAKWIEGLSFLYDWERIERNPWWTAVMALSGGVLTQEDIVNSRRTLRELPDDVREWLFDNHYRRDIGKIGPARNGGEQCEVVLPYDEMRTMWWNGNPRDVVDGGAGNSFKAPTFFLLPYYMNVYSGVITK